MDPKMPSLIRMCDIISMAHKVFKKAIRLELL